MCNSAKAGRAAINYTTAPTLTEGAGAPVGTFCRLRQWGSLQMLLNDFFILSFFSSFYDFFLCCLKQSLENTVHCSFSIPSGFNSDSCLWKLRRKRHWTEDLGPDSDYESKGKHYGLQPLQVYESLWGNYSGVQLQRLPEAHISSAWTGMLPPYLPAPSMAHTPTKTYLICHFNLQGGPAVYYTNKERADTGKAQRSPAGFYP